MRTSEYYGIDVPELGDRADITVVSDAIVENEKNQSGKIENMKASISDTIIALTSEVRTKKLLKYYNGLSVQFASPINIAAGNSYKIKIDNLAEQPYNNKTDIKAGDIVQAYYGASGFVSSNTPIPRSSSTSSSSEITVATSLAVKNANDNANTRALKTVQVVAGKGLTGGGDMSTDRTIDVVSKNDGIIVNDNDIQLNVYDGVDSSSTTRAGSARAVKAAYDKGVEGLYAANTKLDAGSVSVDYNTGKKIEDKIRGLEGVAVNKLDKGGYTGTALDLDNIKFGNRGDLQQITGELLDFKNKVKAGCYDVTLQQSRLLAVPYEQAGKLYVDYVGRGLYLRFITEMYNYNGDVGRGIYIIHVNNFSPTSGMTFANTMKWYKLSMEDSLINLGNAGISSIRYIQEVGEKLAEEGYIDIDTGKLYIAKVKNTDVTVTTNFRLATNVENAKYNLKNNETNFQIIAGSIFDGAAAKAIVCKKIGRIGVVEFVNAELSKEQTFYLPSWFKPLYTSTYGSIVSEDENKAVEINVSKTQIKVYPASGKVGSSTNGATGQVVVILEE